MTKRNIAYPPEVKGHPILQECWNEANWKNSNFIISINGLPGRGKSTLAQYMQYVLDRGNDYSFRCELKNWCLTQRSFLEATNKNINQVGRVIVWEEPYAGGVKEGGSNARDFQRYASKQISTVFNTMRKNNHIIILTLPQATLFDKQARQVAHCQIWVQRNNGVYGTARVYLRDYNPIFDIEKFPFQKVNLKTGMVRVKNLFFGLPPRKWADACNEKSDDYKNFWQKEIEGYKAKEKGGRSRPNNKKAEFIMKCLKNPQEYMIEKNSKLVWDRAKMMKEFDIPYNTAGGFISEFKAVSGE